MINDDVILTEQLFQCLLNMEVPDTQVQKDIAQTFCEISVKPNYSRVVCMLYINQGNNLPVLKQLSLLLFKLTSYNENILETDMGNLIDALVRNCDHSDDFIRKYACYIIINLIEMYEVDFKVVLDLFGSLDIMIKTYEADPSKASSNLYKLLNCLNDFTTAANMKLTFVFLEFQTQIFTLTSPGLCTILESEFPCDMKRQALQFFKTILEEVNEPRQPEFETCFTKYWNAITMCFQDTKLADLIISNLQVIFNIRPNFILSQVTILRTHIFFWLQYPSSYETKFNCTRFLILLFRNKEFSNFFKENYISQLPAILPNIVFSEHDYMQLNSGLTQKHSDKEELSSTEDLWGAQYTLRKASAYLLDFYGMAFRDEVMLIVLQYVEPLLKSKDEVNWQYKESAILILGALATYTVNSLNPYFKSLLDILIPLCNHEIPAVSCITIWTLGRLCPVLQNIPEFFEQVLQIILRIAASSTVLMEQAAQTALNFILLECKICGGGYLKHFATVLSMRFNNYKFNTVKGALEIVETMSRQYPDFIKSDYSEEFIVRPLMVLLQKFSIENCDLHRTLFILSSLDHFLLIGIPTIEMLQIIQKFLSSILQNFQYSPESLNNPDIMLNIESCLEIVFKLTQSNDPTILATQQGSEILDTVLSLLNESNKMSDYVLLRVFCIIGQANAYSQKVRDLRMPIISQVCNLMKVDNENTYDCSVWCIDQLLDEYYSIVDYQTLSIYASKVASKILSRKGHRMDVTSVAFGKLVYFVPEIVKPHIDDVFEKWALELSLSTNTQDKITIVKGLINLIQNPFFTEVFLKHLTSFLFVIASCYEDEVLENDQIYKTTQLPEASPELHKSITWVLPYFIQNDKADFLKSYAALCDRGKHLLTKYHSTILKF